MIQKAIDHRELITLALPDSVLSGTYHRTADDRYNVHGRVGVLFLNHLFPARAWKGDSAVHWADSLAGAGYPCFRVDFPGAEDCPWKNSAELLAYVNRGSFARVVGAAITALTARYSLKGIVIFGLCAGAVSGIYTATMQDQCCGLILLDPYFHLPYEPRSPVWSWITRPIPVRLLRFIKLAFERARLLRMSLFGKGIPENSNTSLLRRWKHLIASGLPMLVIKAPRTHLRGGEFDFVQHVMDQVGPNVATAVVVVDGADHTFANRRGWTGVAAEAQNWLRETFPVDVESLRQEPAVSDAALTQSHTL